MEKVYVVTILDNVFGKMDGEFNGENKEQASDAAKNYYANELGSFPEDIEVIDIKEK